MMYNLHTESNNKLCSSLGAGKFIYSRLNEYQNFNMVTKIVFFAKEVNTIFPCFHLSEESEYIASCNYFN